MRGYVVPGPNAAGTSNKTAVTVIASTTVRPAVFDLIVGCSATPADTAAKFYLNRFTAAGTAGSSPTPQATDSSDVAAIATAGITHSAEPTYTAGSILKQIPVNQRATFRYSCSQGYEFKCPATAANGLGLYLVTASASTAYDCELSWFE